MKTTTSALFGTLALLGAFLSARADPTFISTAQGRGADLNVRGGGFANDNFGKQDILRVRNSADLGAARKTYLRFDLSSLVTPAKNATGVTLGLSITPAEGKSLPEKSWTFSVSGLKDGLPEETWDEKDVSWKNAPANETSSPIELSPAAVPLGTFSIQGTGMVGSPVAFYSPEFLKFLRADTNGIVTLIITCQERSDGAGNDVVHIFASKEYTTPAPPVLSVSFNGEKAVLPTAQQWAELPVATHRFPFEDDIAAFEAADLQNPPAPGGVVFVGSSSIRKWTTLAQDFPGLKVINRGFGGSHIDDSVRYAQRIVTPYAPKMIVFYAGTNDIADGKTPEELLANYKAFVKQVRVKLPTTPIAFISVSPAPSRWDKVDVMKKTNSLIKQFSLTEPNLKFIDVSQLMLDANGQPRPELFLDDQLHMKPAGYAIWVKAVAPYLPRP